MTLPETISADYTLRPSELAEVLALLIETRQPTMVWGPPGAAKSMIARQVAAAANRRYVDVRALLLDPVDLRGIPWRDSADRTRWATPVFLPPTDDPGLWLINLEELPSAVPMVQAALYQLFLERKCGEYELPEGASLIACGNRDADRAVVHRMPTPLSNASWSDGSWGYAAFPLFGEVPEIGDRVLFEPPDALNSPVPYLKTVRGVPGMSVSVDPDGTVRLDGEPVGRAKRHALDGRALAAIASGVIPPGHFYLHADHADSHDSRYAEIGLVPRSRILGRAVAMPDVPWIGLEGPLVGPEDVGEAGAATILPHPVVEAPR